MSFLIFTAIYIILACYTTYTFSMLISGLYLPTAIMVDGVVSLITNILTLVIFYIFLICAVENSISLSFYAITSMLALQISKVQSSNSYLILKLLVFASTYKFYYNRHLLLNCYSLLSPDLSYFFKGFPHFSSSSYPFYPSKPFYIIISHF